MQNIWRLDFKTVLWMAMQILHQWTFQLELYRKFLFVKVCGSFEETSTYIVYLWKSILCDAFNIIFMLFDSEINTIQRLKSTSSNLNRWTLYVLLNIKCQLSILYAVININILNIVCLYLFLCPYRIQYWQLTNKPPYTLKVLILLNFTRTDTLW